VDKLLIRIESIPVEGGGEVESDSDRILSQLNWDNVQGICRVNGLDIKCNVVASGVYNRNPGKYSKGGNSVIEISKLTGGLIAPVLGKSKERSDTQSHTPEKVPTKRSKQQVWNQGEPNYEQQGYDQQSWNEQPSDYTR
jgi:hypothetical protein